MKEVLVKLEKPENCKECRFSMTEWNTGTTNCTIGECIYKNEVEAIPVEWILKWANRNCIYCYDYDYPTEKTNGWFDINNMIKDWAKENETNR